MSGGTRLANDAGFVLAMTAMLLIPLTISTAFATDMGSWYAQGTKMQRTSDAAALAGVVWMPDFNTARSIAIQSATQNGYTDGVNGFTVTVTKVAEQRIAVSITGPAQLFFGKTVLKNKSLARSATGEYILAVPLGSPKNFLGTGFLVSNSANGYTAAEEAANRENDWLAMSGKCASKEQGDRKMTISDANWNSGSYSACNVGANGTWPVANTEHDTNGYFYVMDLAANHAGNVYLEVYDAAICNGGLNIDSPTNYSGAGFNINYKVRDKDNTSFNLLDNPILQNWNASPTVNCPGGAQNLQQRWRTLHVFSSPAAGQYLLQVSDANASFQTNRGSNAFSIRARIDGAGSVGAIGPNKWNLCSTEVGSTQPPYSASCPQIHGYRDMGIYLSDPSTSAAFYLADIGNQHSGKTMTITLWDTGEGGSTIQLINPLGVAVNFSWAVANCNPPGAEPAPLGGCASVGAVPLITVSGTGTQPGPHRLSSSRYNDRSITFTYTLPGDIAGAYGGKTWWKVRYTSTSAVTDRSTWTVEVRGDPVHLVA